VGETTAPECPTKVQLTEQYVAAMVEYARTVGLLRSRLGKMRRDEYEQVRASGERAREQSEECRAALERHVEEHGC
jgi:hypothetical protein